MHVTILMPVRLINNSLFFSISDRLNKPFQAEGRVTKGRQRIHEPTGAPQIIGNEVSWQIIKTMTFKRILWRECCKKLDNSNRKIRWICHGLYRTMTHNKLEKFLINLWTKIFHINSPKIPKS